MDDTYTKEERYLNYGDLAVSISMAAETLNLAHEDFDRQVRFTKTILAKHNAENCMAWADGLYEVIHLVLRTLWDIRDECLALDERRVSTH